MERGVFEGSPTQTWHIFLLLGIASLLVRITWSKSVRYTFGSEKPRNRHLREFLQVLLGQPLLLGQFQLLHELFFTRGKTRFVTNGLRWVCKLP